MPAAGWVTLAFRTITARSLKSTLASTPGAHVLLEAVALRAHQVQEPVGPGDGQAPGDPDGDQQQELLVFVADAGDPDRDDQRTAEDPGANFYP